MIYLPQNILERWMSGLNQQFTKLSNLNWFREFESRSLRLCFAVAHQGVKSNPLSIFDYFLANR